MRRDEYMRRRAGCGAFQHMRNHRPRRDRDEAFVRHATGFRKRVLGAGPAAREDQDRPAHAASRRAAAGAIWRIMLSATIVSISSACVKPATTAERENSFSDHRLQLRLTSSSRTRSEEHTSELQSLMRISYAVFCLKKKKKK